MGIFDLIKQELVNLVLSSEKGIRNIHKVLLEENKKQGGRAQCSYKDPKGIKDRKGMCWSNQSCCQITFFDD